MAKEKKGKKSKISAAVKQYPNGQEAQLRKIMKQAGMVIAIGVFLLIMCVASSAMITVAKDAQIDVTNALNQYRLASRNLTLSIQSYAVTGNQHYLNAYKNEVETDKNREKALDILREYDITDGEWKKLNSIAALSEELIEYEAAAIAGVEAGNMDWAREQVFGTHYENGVEEITDLTDKVIIEIQERKDSQCNVLEIIQYVCIILFILSVIHFTNATIASIINGSVGKKWYINMARSINI